jgi:hypothetical protein
MKKYYSNCSGKLPFDVKIWRPMYDFGAERKLLGGTAINSFENNKNW